jgi:hypothetical protein
MNNRIQYMQMNEVDNSFIPFHIDLRNEIHSYFSYSYVVKFLSSLVIKRFFFFPIFSNRFNYEDPKNIYQ